MNRTTEKSPEIVMSSAGQEYLRQSRRPLASLVFVLPLLLIYEGGLVALGREAVRNGADVWLRQFLDHLGFTQYFLLPLLTVALLLAWHYVSQERWRLSPTVVSIMLGECAVLAVVLLAAGRAQGLLVQTLVERQLAEARPILPIGRGACLPKTATAPAQAPADMTSGSPSAVGGVPVGRLVGFAGAGVYEEMMFRLMLLPPIFTGVARLGAAGRLRIASAVLLTSLVFAAAHYIGPHGELFEAFGFWFRFLAGAFFAMLFVYRGFGIAAGTHALYDVMVSLS